MDRLEEEGFYNQYKNWLKANKMSKLLGGINVNKKRKQSRKHCHICGRKFEEQEFKVIPAGCDYFLCEKCVDVDKNGKNNSKITTR